MPFEPSPTLDLAAASAPPERWINRFRTRLLVDFHCDICGSHWHNVTEFSTHCKSYPFKETALAKALEVMQQPVMLIVGLTYIGPEQLP